MKKVEFIFNPNTTKNKITLSYNDFDYTTYTTNGTYYVGSISLECNDDDFEFFRKHSNSGHLSILLENVMEGFDCIGCQIANYQDGILIISFTSYKKY